MVGPYGTSVCHQMQISKLFYFLFIFYFLKNTVIGRGRKNVRKQLQQFMMEDTVRFGFGFDF